MIVTTWRVVKKGLEQEAAVYHIHDPELIPHGLILRLLGKRVIYDVHEDYVTSIKQKTYLPRVLRLISAGIFDWFERASARLFTVILAERYYARRFPTGVQVLNYPRIEEFYFRPNTGNIHFAQIKSKYHKKLIYSGTVSVDRGALIYAKMVANIDDIEVTVVGRCHPALAQRMRKVAAGGADRLHIIGEGYYVPFQKIAELYASSDWIAGLAIFPDTPHYREKELTKFFEYMAAGIPIICSDFPVWRDLIESSRVGLCVDPNNIDNIAAAIEQLATSHGDAAAMGERGIERYRNGITGALKGVDFSRSIEGCFLHPLGLVVAPVQLR